MEIKRICLVYFSPTGTTKNVLRFFAKEFEYQAIEYDLTNYKMKDFEMEFTETDFVVFAFPVYSGRVPETFQERLKNIKGNSTAAAIVATYGNREYDDAILEMKNIAEGNGFKTIGAIAVVTEHSVVRTIGAGRPNHEDWQAISEFGKKTKKKILSISDIASVGDLQVSGNIPYRKYLHIPMAPKSTSACNKCKACCSGCPTGALTYDGAIRTDKRKCIGCMRCVRMCPQNARTVGKFKNWGARTIMNARCKGDKSPEMFI